MEGEEHGSVATKGVVVCVQPWLEHHQYTSAKSFKCALDALLSQVDLAERKADEESESAARRRQARLVVFPEMVGTWLVALDELPSEFKGDSSAAMVIVIRRHLWSFVATLFGSLCRNNFRFGLMGHVKRSLFRIKAQAMFEAYCTAFSELAQEHEAWIVAGSILLPRVEYREAQEEVLVPEAETEVVTEDEETLAESRRKEPRRLETRLTSKGLYNVSLSFAPDGSVCNVTHKCFLDSHELEFVDSAPLSAVSAFRSPFGKVAVAICADSWYPQTYDRLREMGADIVCIPAFVTPGHTWDSLWGGYSGRPRHFPSDVDPSDIHHSLESEAWSKYALQGRLQDSGAKLGVCSYLVGKMWDMTGSGESIIVSGQGDILAKSPKGAESILQYEVDLVD